MNEDDNRAPVERTVRLEEIDMNNKTFAENIKKVCHDGATVGAIVCFVESIRRHERNICKAEIDKWIKPGNLQGNGCDDTAQRNGLILASNLLNELSIDA